MSPRTFFITKTKVIIDKFYPQMSFLASPSHLSFVADFPDDDDDYDSDDTTHRQALKSVNETDRQRAG